MYTASRKENYAKLIFAITPSIRHQFSSFLRHCDQEWLRTVCNYVVALHV